MINVSGLQQFLFQRRFPSGARSLRRGPRVPIAFYPTTLEILPAVYPSLRSLLGKRRSISPLFDDKATPVRAAQNHKSPAKCLKAGCAAERLDLADNPVRQAVRGSPQKCQAAVTETPLLFPPSKSAEYVNQACDLHKRWRPRLNELGIKRRPPIQLPSHLCDNTRNVRPQPRIYRPTAGSQRSDAAVDVCPLA